MPRTRPPQEDPIARACRRDAAYHNTPAGAYDCGFLVKSGPMHAYVDRPNPDYIMVCVLRGRGRFIDGGGRVHPVEAGCCCQHMPGKTHGLIPDSDDWAEFYFRFPAPLYEALRRLGLLSQRPVLRPGPEPELVERCERLLQEARPAGNADLPLLLARMHDLLVTIQRMDQRGRRADRDRSVIDLACESLGRDLERDLSLGRLAEDLGLSYERFRKLFRQRVGQSPGEYRIRRRIDHARHLLAHQRLSIKETAYRMGYPDPFTFSKQFKRFTGQSPSAFQRMG